MQQRQQGAAVVPAGVVGEVGADETVREAQFLVHGHTGHLHHHPPVVPAVDWAAEDRGQFFIRALTIKST